MSKLHEKGHVNLLDYESIWRSKMGGSIPGERVVFRGKDAFSEFKNSSWMELQYYCITGNMPSTAASKFLNGLFCMCFNYPDPRIWCNRISALAATASSTAQLAVCAGSSATEAEIYGGPTGIKAMDFLFRLKNEMENGIQLQDYVEEELKLNKAIYGFGRPVLPIDERVKPALDLLAELSLVERDYIQLAIKVEEFLSKSRYKLNLNIAGVFAAFCADEGLKREDIYYLTIVGFSIGMLACYLDADSQPNGALFPIRCERISYQGVNHREW
jgi:citrate synthase